MDEVTPETTGPIDDAHSEDAAFSRGVGAGPGDPASPGPSGEVSDASTRVLRRSSQRRLIAGVAQGLGERFDINPNVFRVVFVVGALFWGLGAAAYLALWVFVPRGEGDDGSRGRLPVSTSRRLTYALLAGLLTVVVVVVLVALGAGARHAVPGIGVLWLIFLVVLAVVALRTPARRITLRRVFAVLLLTGLSVVILVVAGAMAYLGSTGVPLSGGDGAHTWAPTTLAEVQHSYPTEFGEGNVDLSAVEFPSTGSRVEASVAVGELMVEVPADAVVTVASSVGLGTVGSPDVVSPQGFFSPGDFQAVPTNLTTPGQIRHAPHLYLELRVGVGRIFLARSSG